MGTQRSDRSGVQGSVNCALVPMGRGLYSLKLWLAPKEGAPVLFQLAPREAEGEGEKDEAEKAVSSQTSKWSRRLLHPRIVCFPR